MEERRSIEEQRRMIGDQTAVDRFMILDVSRKFQSGSISNIESSTPKPADPFVSRLIPATASLSSDRALQLQPGRRLATYVQHWLVAKEERRCPTPST